MLWVLLVVEELIVLFELTVVQVPVVSVDFMGANELMR